MQSLKIPSKKSGKKKSGLHKPVYAWIKHKNYKALKTIAFYTEKNLDECIDLAIEEWIKSQIQKE